MFKLYKRIVWLATCNENSINSNFDKKWKSELKANSDKSIPTMLEELEDIQQNLMRNPLDKFLGCRKKLQD